MEYYQHLCFGIHYHYVNAYVTLGNDFDRISGNNDEPRVEYCYSGSWASTLFNSTSESNSYNKPAILTTVNPPSKIILKYRQPINKRKKRKLFFLISNWSLTNIHLKRKTNVI